MHRGDETSDLVFSTSFLLEPPSKQTSDVLEVPLKAPFSKHCIVRLTLRLLQHHTYSTALPRKLTPVMCRPSRARSLNREIIWMVSSCVVRDLNNLRLSYDVQKHPDRNGDILPSDVADSNYGHVFPYNGTCNEVEKQKAPLRRARIIPRCRVLRFSIFLDVGKRSPDTPSSQSPR